MDFKIVFLNYFLFIRYSKISYPSQSDSIRNQLYQGQRSKNFQYMDFLFDNIQYFSKSKKKNLQERIDNKYVFKRKNSSHFSGWNSIISPVQCIGFAISSIHTPPRLNNPIKPKINFFKYSKISLYLNLWQG